MASISRETNGRKTIQYMAPDGKRRSIRLGKVSQRAAEAVRTRVEHLVGACITGHAIDDESSRWVAGLDTKLHDKLSAVGLIQKRDSLTLSSFLDSYIKSRTDVKPSTATVYGHTRRNLIEHFGADNSLRDITPGDADDWRLSLIRQDLADNTVRRRCGIAKQFFGAAMRRKLVSSNPFTDLVATVRKNTRRLYFISLGETQKVLDACPDAEWRLIFVIESLWSACGAPRETLQLRWEDADWARNRITIRSPKTEHHPGGESRQIPLFPEPASPSSRSVRAS